MHKIISPILIGIIFYCTVFPTGVVLKILGKDPMRRKFEADSASYWQPREDAISKTFFDNQF